MKTIRIRILIGILFAFVCWLLPSSSWASVEIDGIYYDLDTSSKIAVVAQNPTHYSGQLTIPDNVSYNGYSYSVTSIRNSAFYDCTDLTSVTIPNSVISIGNGAFAFCTGLTSVTIPNSVTIIDGSAFQGCTGLTSISISCSVICINSYAFYGCTSLTSISVDVNNTRYDSRDNCNAIIETATNSLIVGCKNTVIPTSVTSIGLEAFYGCTGLTSVTIPNNVTEISSSAFEGCTGLTSMTIPKSVTSIGGYAFSDCTGLTSITCESEIPVTLPSTYVFNNIDKSTCTLYVPFGSKTAYASAEYWNEFENIEESPLLVGNLYYQLNISDNTAIIDRIADQNYSGSIVIPESIEYAGNTYTVTTIGNSAFENCAGLTSVSIPNSVTSIGDYAFHDCSNLESITFGNGLTSIGDEAFNSTAWYDNQPVGLVYAGTVVYAYKDEFDSNTSHEEILIKEGTLSINPEAFLWEDDGEQGSFGVFSFASITLPSSLTFLQPYCQYSYLFMEAYNTCLESSINAKSLSVDPNNPIFDSRNNCNAIIETSSNKLIVGNESTIIPDGVTTIGTFSLGRLTSVSIPSSVVLIEEGAFSPKHYHKKSAPWGNGEIRDYYASSPVEVIKMEGVTPPIAGLQGVNKTSCTLYVPVGSKSAYESASGWSEFENIVEYDPDTDTDISALDNAIYIEPIEGRIGGTKVVSVKMKDNYDVCAFQFVMRVPEGVTITGWNLSSKRLSEAVSTPEENGKILDDGKAIKIGYSLTGKTYSGDDGEIATVNLSFSEDMEEGSYPIYLIDCHSNGIDCVDVPMSDIKATLTLEDYVVGDANGDGQVLIGDVTALLNYIVGRPISNFKENAADVNGDGVILVGDVTALLNIIVNQVPF